MKKLRVILITAIAAVALSSCINGSSNYVPTIHTSYFTHNWHDSLPGDTMTVWTKDGEHRLDTIAVGDSVRFAIILNSYANNLVSFTMEYSDADLAFEFPYEGFQKALDTAKSDVPHGKYYFLPGYYGVAMPVQYKALRAGTSEFKMTVVSDAQFSNDLSNITSVRIQQTVK